MSSGASMTKDQQTCATVLAKHLAEHVAGCGIEQYRVLMVGRETGAKSIVMVTTTDRASERLLEWLDAEADSGHIATEYLEPTFNEKPNGATGGHDER